MMKKELLFNNNNNRATTSINQDCINLTNLAKRLFMNHDHPIITHVCSTRVGSK